MPDVDVLLVGGGLAAGNCARWLREEGFEGSVALCGRELDPPYNRPPCSKGHMQGKESREEVLFRPDEWWKEQTRVVDSWSGPGLHPAHVVQAIGKAFGREAIYVVDGGFTSLWAYWFLPSTRPRSYLSILELGMLGTGVPSALGAKLGSPGREVVCVTGDGAAGFHFMEMQSAARERAKVTVIVFAEGSWSMEVPNEQMLYGKNFGTEMGTVRWDVVAQGLGCEALYAESLREVETALAKARDVAGPLVICVRTDRMANLGVAPEAGMRFAEVYQGPI